MTDIRKIVIDYEAMYRALVRRLVEIADSDSREVEHDMDRVTFYDRVARAHEPNIKEEDDGHTP